MQASVPVKPSYIPLACQLHFAYQLTVPMHSFMFSCANAFECFIAVPAVLSNRSFVVGSGLVKLDKCWAHGMLLATRKRLKFIAKPMSHAVAPVDTEPYVSVSE